jgi:dTDP-4-amino-4,6-dideoxygalactose transaminase
MLDTWRVMRSGRFILDKEVKAFEKEFAEFVNADSCVAVGNGHDAIKFALMALGSKVVVTPTNVPLAVWSAVASSGARIVPVDVERHISHVVNYTSIDWSDVDTLLIVHMFGLYSPIIRNLIPKHVRIVEDFSQAHMAQRVNKDAGKDSEYCAWSFYPTKNIGALGDAGAVTIHKEGNCAELTAAMDKIKDMREYGRGRTVGANSRMDELQAAYLRTKLKTAEKEWYKRCEIAYQYYSYLSTRKLTFLSSPLDNHSYHQFVIVSKSRDMLQYHLRENGISTMVHYPTYPILMPQYSHLYNTNWSNVGLMAREYLSLPIHSGMSKRDINHVIEKVNKF